MKKITRILTIFLATAFFFCGLPATGVFAAENPSAPEEAVAAMNAAEEGADAAPETAAEVQEEPEGDAQDAAVKDETLREEAAAPQEAAVQAEPEAEAEPQTDLSTTPAEEPSDETDPTAPAEEEPSSEPASEPQEETPSEPASEPKQDTPSETPSKPQEETTKPEDSTVTLSVTNNTNMFKVVSAYVETKNGKSELVVALSGQSYDNLFIGTYEEAVAAGYDTNKWISYFKDKAGKKAFRIPITKDTTYLPVISISNTYLKSYQEKKNSLARAFYARQMQLDLSAKTLVCGDYEYTKNLTVKNSVKNFDVDSASLHIVGGPNNNGYEASLMVKMKDNTYDAGFIGTKKQAAASEKTLPIGKNKVLTLPIKWLETFGDPDSLQSLMGKTFTVSFRNAKTEKWTEHLFTVKEKNGTLTIEDETEDKKPSKSTEKITIPGQTKEEEKNEKSDVGGTTAAVDNATGLKDGTYKPDKFSFSGGSGKVVITCDKVEVKDGKAYATIVFRNVKSGTTEFSYVKANGQTYYCTQVGGTSVVTIPVELNANTPILGLTTKMSAAHEIAYTIFVYISGADKKADDLTKNKELDEEAPEIAGLEAAGQEELEEAEFFKVFNYSDGIRLLEIDMRREDEKDEKEAFEEVSAKEDKEEEEDGLVVIDEETGEEISIPASKADAQAKLYKGNIIKYLLVPENVEIPAGLDKETIVVTLPVDSVYSGSEAVRKTMESLKIEKCITSEEKENKEKEIKGAGAFEDLSVRALVASKCDLALISDDFFEKDDARDIFNAHAEDFANLDIVLITDRSAAEKTAKAKAEWLKVYGMLFGCEEAAQQAYNAVQ